MLLLPLMLASIGPAQQGKGSAPTQPELPPGEARDLVVKDCVGCHQLGVVISPRKSEDKWTDTVIEMRNRGAKGSDEDMEQIILYLAANFGPSAPPPSKVNVNFASGPVIVSVLLLPEAEADAIVAYRKEHGPLKDIAGLKQVPGVEASKIDAVKDKIEF
jgi:competence protein ComEA